MDDNKLAYDEPTIEISVISDGRYINVCDSETAEGQKGK